MISVFEPLYGPWFILVTSKQQGPAGLLRHQFQPQPRWGIEMQLRFSPAGWPASLEPRFPFRNVTNCREGSWRRRYSLHSQTAQTPPSQRSAVALGEATDTLWRSVCWMSSSWHEHVEIIYHAMPVIRL
jgi:hypothetical protein